MYVDVHAHIDHCEAPVLDVVNRAKDAGLKAIICNGLNFENNKVALSLASKFDIVQAALGCYPTYADKATEEEISLTIEQIKKNKANIIAIGEIGLDLHWLKDLKKQQKVFEEMLTLCEKTKLPPIIHSRKAEKEVIDCLQSTKLKKVDLHCFGGKMSIAKKAMDLGYTFSIPANVVRDDHFQQLVKLVPLQQLLTETDSPYLGPVANKGNEPANVVEGVKKIAEIKKITHEECKNMIYMNYQKMFL